MSCITSGAVIEGSNSVLTWENWQLLMSGGFQYEISTTSVLSYH